MAVVHVMSCNGAVKLGRSINPEHRAKVLSNGASVVTLVHTTPLRDDASFVEATAHRILAHKRRHGEWFDVTVDEAIAAIDAAVRAVEMRKGVLRCKACQPERVMWPKRQTERPLLEAISLRLAPDLMARIDKLTAERIAFGSDRATVLREIIERGLRAMGV